MIQLQQWYCSFIKTTAPPVVLKCKDIHLYWFGQDNYWRAIREGVKNTYI